MSTDFRSLQERLRQRLLVHIAAGELTGLQLAQETGFQQAHISNFLNRKRGLSLEAMDAILRARKLTVRELLGEANPSGAKRRTIHAESASLTHIPLVEDETCLATEVPFSAAKNALEIATRKLEKLRPNMYTPRPHWQRFVAMVVSSVDARAMAPRLSRGAMVVIDRHFNAIVSTGGPPPVYLVQAGERCVLRYVEHAGKEIVLRPHNPEAGMTVLEERSAIVGRVCLVISEV